MDARYHKNNQTGYIGEQTQRKASDEVGNAAEIDRKRFDAAAQARRRLYFSLDSKLAQAPGDDTLGVALGQTERQGLGLGAHSNQFFPHGEQGCAAPLVFFDGGRAVCELLIDAAQTALQGLFFLLENNAELLANFAGLLVQGLVDVRQIDSHLQDDFHQPLDGLEIHWLPPLSFEKSAQS
jgi:hypothetical protein